MIILTAVSINLIGDWLFERLTRSERRAARMRSRKPLLEVARPGDSHGAVPIARRHRPRVARGETIAIVGESGSGKSLTAKAIAGCCRRASSRRAAVASTAST